MMNTKQFISIIAISGCLGLFATNADAQRDHTIDCDNGDSIQAALDKQVGHAGPITIDVIGTCEENVSIRRDDVTINGNSAATISGRINIEGSNRITIVSITVTGPGVGIEAIGSRVTLYNVTVTDNQEWTAIVANESSSLKISNSNISNNSGIGVFIGLSSSLVTDSNTIISNNSEAGVQLSLSSSALLWRAL